MHLPAPSAELAEVKQELAAVQQDIKALQDKAQQQPLTDAEERRLERLEEERLELRKKENLLRAQAGGWVHVEWACCRSLTI